MLHESGFELNLGCVGWTGKSFGCGIDAENTMVGDVGSPQDGSHVGFGYDWVGSWIDVLCDITLEMMVDDKIMFRFNYIS